MSEPAIRRPSANRRWLMTTEAWRSLVDEVSGLRADVAALAGEVRDDGVLHLPATRAARRLEVLSGVLDAAERVDDPDRAVIGRRATLLEEDGESVSYALVFPGDGDPAQGWISADSPLGAAVLGAAPGEFVAIFAPAGRRAVKVLAVE